VHLQLPLDGKLEHFEVLGFVIAFRCCRMVPLSVAARGMYLYMFNCITILSVIQEKVSLVQVTIIDPEGSHIQHIERNNTLQV
jgi:hypothetical protein